MGKKSSQTLLICIAIPVLTGLISGLLTRGNMDAYMSLNRPALSPPGWLFPVVWTVLYILMGIASYYVYTSDAPPEVIRHALEIYGLQLFFNFFWSFIFFSFAQYFVAFIWLLLLWAAIILTISRFKPLSSVAAALLVPYLLWVTFAGYLNLSVYLLN